MVQLQRVRVALTGFPGAPGVSTFYAIGATSIVPAIHTMYAGLTGGMPSDVSVQVESSGDTIDDATGDIIGSWSEAAQSLLVGAQATAYAAPVGGVMTWLTDGIVHGHRVKGRTFVVPLVGTDFTVGGGLTAGRQTAMKVVGDAYIASSAGSAAVWSRPFAGSAATATRPAIPARPGSAHAITACRVPSLAAVLRSRRD